MFQEVYKIEPRHFKGYRRTNYNPTIYNKSTKHLFHKITPVGLASPQHLCNKATSILGNLKLYNQWHPLFELLLFKTVLYQGTSGNDQTALFKDLAKGLRLTPRQQFEKFFISIKSRAEKCLEVLKPMSRLEQLKEIEKMLVKEAGAAMEKAEELLEQSREGEKKTELQSLLSKEAKLLFLTEQKRSLLALEPLRTDQQAKKLQLFAEKHALAFEALHDIDNDKRPFILLSGSTIGIVEPVLQNLPQFLELQDQLSHQDLNIHFIKYIYDEIATYDKKVKDKLGRRSPYPNLSPHAVVVDQLTLSPYLHYEPPLLEALGLKQNPDTIESLLALSPTPRGPDYFRSLPELDPTYQLMDSDPFFGCPQLVEGKEGKEMEEERRKLQQFGDRSLTWRFLLLSYFILNKGEEFGRMPNPLSEQQAIDYFHSSLEQAERKMRSNPEQLQLFIGSSNQSLDNANVGDSFLELGEFISQQKDDSLIANHRHQRQLKYLGLRWLLLRESITMLQSRDKQAFAKMINVKKYIIMFLLVEIELFEEAQVLDRAEEEKPGERELLRGLIESSVVRIRKDTPEDYLMKLFQKIRSYRGREKNDPGLAYLAEDQDYVYKLISKHYEKAKLLKAYCKELDRIEKEVGLKDKTHYKELLQKSRQLVEETRSQVETFLKEFLFLEVKLHKAEQIHKSNKVTREGWQVVTERFLLTIFSLLSLDPDKYPLYDALVVPHLNLGELNPYREENPMRAPSSNEEVLLQKEQLQVVSSLIQFEQLLPARLTLIKNHQNTLAVPF